MTNRLDFSPDWASAPGRTIQVLLDRQGKTTQQLSEKLSLTTSGIRRLLDGQVEIDQQIAAQLSSELGGSAKFWVTRDREYRAALEAPRFSLDAFASSIPLKDMIRFGWLDRFKRGDGDAAAALRFFGLSNPEEFEDRCLLFDRPLAFHRSYAFDVDRAALAAWFRAAEIQAAALEYKRWSRDSFHNALDDIRQLTREKEPKIFLPALRDICAESGVAVALVRAPRGCPVSGATFFTEKGLPIILLSFRYLTDDHFWFSFFHEAGHVILHAETEIFMEMQDSAGSEKEREANDFSAETLIPSQFVDELTQLKAEKYQVVRFARKLGIAPGVVVGQLQHRGLIRRNQLNFLKRRYKWQASLERQ